MIGSADTLRAIDLPGQIPGLKKSGAYWIGPCPFCGGDDRFNVKQTDDGAYLWICRHCAPDKYHDAIDYLKRLTGKSFAELVDAPGPAVKIPAAPSTPKATKVTIKDAPPGDWQSAASAIACDCVDYLYSDQADARAALAYLIDYRKLTEHTLQTASIGYNPTRREVMPGHWLEPGITIPSLIGGDLWYLNVRTTKAARRANPRLSKYRFMTGSIGKSIYGADQLYKAYRAVFVCEGEFDALVMRQYCPPGVTAVTMGSATSWPDSVTWARFFAVAERILLVLDNDEPGQYSAARWHDILPRAEVVTLPDGYKDASDYRAGGGRLWSWISDTLA